MDGWSQIYKIANYRAIWGHIVSCDVGTIAKPNPLSTSVGAIFIAVLAKLRPLCLFLYPWATHLTFGSTAMNIAPTLVESGFGLAIVPTSQDTMC
ncbi:MAG: hypothetical protein KKI03_12315, partial [Gammaproteobacteria bacterium]|nr:hypothetical protein [Gammaproteobacteria bacterium]